jgi:transcriptional regulator with XRE-family HTH domain
MTMTTLRRHRIRLGLTLDQLARQCGLSRSHLSNLELGRRRVDSIGYAAAVRLAGVLAISVERLTK